MRRHQSGRNIRPSMLKRRSTGPEVAGTLIDSTAPISTMLQFGIVHVFLWLAHYLAHTTVFRNGGLQQQIIWTLDGTRIVVEFHRFLQNCNQTSLISKMHIVLWSQSHMAPDKCILFYAANHIWHQITGCDIILSLRVVWGLFQWSQNIAQILKKVSIICSKLCCI